MTSLTWLARWRGNEKKTKQLQEHKRDQRSSYIYKSVWTQIIGEGLVLVPEDNNKHDKHTVAVMKDGFIVGHVTRSIF